MFWVTTGMGEPNRPFLDLYGLLAANDAVNLGMDPYRPSLLDPYHRPHVYSEWWLVSASWGLGRKDVIWLGFVFAGSLLLTAVTMARPRNWSESLQLLLLLLSPAFILAAHRGNNDLVILVIVSAGLVCFRRAEMLWQVLGVLLCALSAVLKYYPLTTVVLLLGLRDRRSLLWGLALYLLVLVLAVPGLLPGFRSAANNMPVPIWLYAFGAPVLMRDFQLTNALIWLLPGVAIVVWALVTAWRQPLPETPAPQDAAEREFVCGAAMLVGLFFLGASFVYKLIFALWLLPWLWQREAGREGQRWRQAILLLLGGVVWLEGAMALALNRWASSQAQDTNQFVLKIGLVFVQLLTWVLIAALCRWLFVYLVRWLRALRPAALAKTA